MRPVCGYASDSFAQEQEVNRLEIWRRDRPRTANNGCSRWSTSRPNQLLSVGSEIRPEICIKRWLRESSQ